MPSSPRGIDARNATESTDGTRKERKCGTTRSNWHVWSSQISPIVSRKPTLLHNAQSSKRMLLLNIIALLLLLQQVIFKRITIFCLCVFWLVCDNKSVPQIQIKFYVKQILTETNIVHIFSPNIIQNEWSTSRVKRPIESKCSEKHWQKVHQKLIFSATSHSSKILLTIKESCSKDWVPTLGSNFLYGQL